MTRVFLDGPIPFVWSGIEDSIGGINARWLNSDLTLVEETFAQSASKRKVTSFDLTNGTGSYVYRYEEEEWV